MTPVVAEPLLGYHPCSTVSNQAVIRRGQGLTGSLTGAVARKRIGGAKGFLRMKLETIHKECAKAE